MKTDFKKKRTREEWDQLLKELLAEKIETYKKNQMRQRKFREKQKENKNVRKK